MMLFCTSYIAAMDKDLRLQLSKVMCDGLKIRFDMLNLKKDGMQDPLFNKCFFQDSPVLTDEEIQRISFYVDFLHQQKFTVNRDI